jgi:hypothetical protein
LATCKMCRKKLPAVSGGRPAVYCSAACRQRAYRKRAADPARSMLQALKNDLFAIKDRTARAKGAVKVLEDLGYTVTLEKGAPQHKQQSLRRLKVVETALQASQEAARAAYHGARLTAQSLRDAYDRVVKASGFSDVLISDLAAALPGVPLEVLKDRLVRESKAGRAVPSAGDWSLSSPESREAAIEVNGRPHTRVRLLGEGRI